MGNTSLMCVWSTQGADVWQPLPYPHNTVGHWWTVPTKPLLGRSSLTFTTQWLTVLSNLWFDSHCWSARGQLLLVHMTAWPGLHNKSPPVHHPNFLPFLCVTQVSLSVPRGGVSPMHVAEPQVPQCCDLGSRASFHHSHHGCRIGSTMAFRSSWHHYNYHGVAGALPLPSCFWQSHDTFNTTWKGHRNGQCSNPAPNSIPLMNIQLSSTRDIMPCASGMYRRPNLVEPDFFPLSGVFPFVESKQDTEWFSWVKGYLCCLFEFLAAHSCTTWFLSLHFFCSEWILLFHASLGLHLGILSCMERGTCNEPGWESPSQQHGDLEKIWNKVTKWWIISV